MAATLTEEGRAPAVQEITRAEFEHFVKACLEPPIFDPETAGTSPVQPRRRWSSPRLITRCIRN
jgi:hypothetical protein